MTFGQRLAAMQLAQRESEIRQAIARERRPVFGTGKMRRVSRCILARLGRHVPRAALTRRLGGRRRRCVTAARAWDLDLRTPPRPGVDLPDGWSWEPVEATTLPTPEFYHRADPQNIVRYRTADELRTALLAEGWTPGDKMSFFEAALCGLLNDGVPASGEIIWEDTARSR